MESAVDDDLETVKAKLRSYTETDILFNEPHFTRQLMMREGSRAEVMGLLLNPEKLVYVYHERGSFGDIVHCLHFKISNTRTMKLPVIFDRHGRKILYILTYIMRYRPWQNMILKRKVRR